MTKYQDRPYYVVMFCSRNKDNQNVDGFKQRNRSFLTQKTNDELILEFEAFVNRGVQGETCRFYRTVNERNINVIKKSLMKHLIDNDDASLVNVEKLIASLAMKNGTTLTKRWLFDYDGNKEELEHFILSLESEGIDRELIRYSETPNGYAVVTERGCDTRYLLEYWQNVSLHRDGMLFYAIKKKV